MRVSYSGVKFDNFDLHQRPVSREPLGFRAPYSLCVPYVHVPTHSVNGMAVACVV